MKNQEYKPNAVAEFFDRLFPQTTEKGSKNYVEGDVYQYNKQFLRGMLYSDFKKARRSHTKIN